MQPENFKHTLKGQFNLHNQNKYFGGWPTITDFPERIVMSFSVEADPNEYATVILEQQEDELTGTVYCKNEIAGKAFKQAIENVSADIDGTNWPAIGNNDPIIDALQVKHHFVRPNLFNSTYEAAAGFVIGNRISIKQKQGIITNLSEEIGGRLTLGNQIVYSFPAPDAILALTEHPSINKIKLERLKAVAEASVSGLLNREYLLSLPVETALEKLKTIKGVGEFYAQGILFRGAGIVNELTQDDLTGYAIQQAYSLNELPTIDQINEIAAKWSPYKMWALVLLHIWLRQEVGLPKRKFK